MALFGYVIELLILNFISDDFKQSFKQAHVSVIFYTTCPVIGLMVFMITSIVYNIKQYCCNYNL